MKTDIKSQDITFQKEKLLLLNQLPEDWIAKRLKFLTLERIAGPFGSSLTKDMYVNEGYRVYGQEQVIPSDFTVGDYYIDAQKFKEMQRYAVQSGDILVSCVGTFGKIAVVPPAAKAGIINPRLILLRPDTSQVIPKYLGQVLSSEICFSQLDKFSRGGTMGVVNLSLLNELIVPIPPQEKQERILDFLDRKTAAIDTLIAKKQRLIELLEEKRAALINQAVTKGLNPDVPMKDSGIPWIGEIPEHWMIKRVKNVIGFVTSGSRGWADYYTSNEEDPIFLQSGNLGNQMQLVLSPIQNVNPPKGTEGERTIVRQGDILVCVTGARTGNVAIVRQQLREAYVNQHVAILRPLLKKLDFRFLGYALKSETSFSQFLMSQYGGTKQGLGLEDIKNVVFCCPPRDEQIKLADSLDIANSQTNSTIEKLNSQIEKLQEYRQSLITAAVTGKLEVPADEAAY